MKGENEMADRWIWGCVNANGTTHSGSGFTVERLSNAGSYIITYDTPFSATPAVVLTQQFANPYAWDNFNYKDGMTLDNAVLVASDKTHFKLKTGDNDGNGSYRNFTFIAFGPVS